MGESAKLVRDVRTGEKLFYKNITFSIVEKIETKDFMGRELVVLSYQIIDGNFQSQVAHLFLHPLDNIKEWVMKIVENYIQIKQSMLRGARR